MIRVCVFCGGHGGTSLVRELAKRPDIHTTLLVNGYDNGLSTGLLRGLVPGMLGPSDFRKNLTHHLDSADPRDAALLGLMEFRMPMGSTLEDLTAHIRAASGGVREAIGWDLLPVQVNRVCVDGLTAVADHLTTVAPDADLGDCALPNLVIAGLYLRLGGFNEAIAVLGEAVGSPIEVLDITSGENAYLMARKADGQILFDEADIVAEQSASPITGIHLVTEQIPVALRERFARSSRASQQRWFASHAAVVTLDKRADVALRRADVVVLAAGTQFSSLIPSYRTPGVTEAMVEGRSRVRCLLVNIRHDKDIQGLDAEHVVDNALTGLGDAHNRRRALTHVLLSGDGKVRPAHREWGQHRGALVVEADLTDPDHPAQHHGANTLRALLDLVDANGTEPREMIPSPSDPVCWMFDLDGTLVDSSPAHEAAFQEAISTCCPDLDPADFHYADVLGQSTGAIAFFLGVPDAKVTEFTDIKRAAYRRMAGEGMVHTLPGARELLTQLNAAGHQVMVVSGGSAASTMASLRATGLLDLVDHVVPGDLVPRSKPAPDVYLRALDLAAPELRPVAVEDSRAGVSAALAAGLDTIQVGEPLGIEGTCWVPDLDTLAELAGLGTSR
ncbi:HAD hydrolase, family IA [Propionibacterium sp. oral taxon 192 str. F0372]|uniref:HAD-IA family hydrolase n=1 Tax=Propionibacterium sp. oral taxon 192 TaxID=671222 RepID=UPI000353057B|nr:HAD-IA family hydrolase [Propionibacterium sp. oral taxon 192]EPH02550.1 HAD hydrolase, family IA [Propionibacterium sp. oral taxon 192 str. F0372]